MKYEVAGGLRYMVCFEVFVDCFWYFVIVVFLVIQVIVYERARFSELTMHMILLMDSH